MAELRGTRPLGVDLRSQPLRLPFALPFRRPGDDREQQLALLLVAPRGREKRLLQAPECGAEVLLQVAQLAERALDTLAAEPIPAPAHQRVRASSLDRGQSRAADLRGGLFVPRRELQRHLSNDQPPQPLRRCAQRTQLVLRILLPLASTNPTEENRPALDTLSRHDTPIATYLYIKKS